jgi:multicomponent Na+:H+ antiporter subunit D
MIFGIGLATLGGYTGAIFYVVHHITIQTALFLVLGLVERRAGSTSVIRLGGLARLFPLLGVLFFVPAMNLAGIPPMSGFLGKVGLVEAGLRTATPLAYALVAASMLTSLLTLYAMAKAWNLAFWRTPAEAHDTARRLSDPETALEVVRHRDHVHVDGTVFETRDLEEARRVVDEDEDSELDLHQLLETAALPPRLPVTMVGITAALIAFSLALTVVAGPLFAYAHRAATDLRERHGYVAAVLPGSAR